MGIENCAQLQDKPLGFLKKEFGPKLGQSLYNYCRGIDDRPINFEQERKSVSAEVNYGIRFDNLIEMEKFLGQLSDEVAMRLVKSGNLKGRQITLKVMVSPDFTQFINRLGSTIFFDETSQSSERYSAQI